MKRIYNLNYNMFKDHFVAQFYLGLSLIYVTHFAIKTTKTIRHPPPRAKNAIPKK